ncbi:MAG: MoaD/ThiS family protein [Coriobacteriia bacterium]|nr:MoaD/ThiS family protein [Coriobacteriia bacterium]
MALITAAYRGPLADTLGTPDEKIEASAVSEVLRHIKIAHGKPAWQTAKAMLIVVNGVSILHGKGFRTALHDGDVVTFLPIAAGG